jgi:homoserine dehydrogenase
MDLKIALVGAGYVGQGFLALLRKKRELIQSRYGIAFQLVYVCDRLAGSLLAPAGLRITDILPILEDGGSLLDYHPVDQTCIKGLDVAAGIETSQADVVVECTYSNLDTGEPAASYIRQSLSQHKHVVTSNKGATALHFRELRELARANNVKFLFGGTLMSGTPIINVMATTFRIDEVLEIRSLLNVSTNYILGAMEQGRSYEEAQAEADELGLLEANPSLDLDGYDAMAKLVILVNMLTGTPFQADQVLREGIANITARDVQLAMDKGVRYKMVAHAWREEGNWKAQVGPFKIDARDPLYHVPMTRNAIQIKTETLGTLYIEGPGTGKKETGHAILSDILSIFVI